jgi:hypothetical protein
MTPWLAFLLFALPPALEEWRTGIEARAGVPVLVATVEFSGDQSEMRLPADVPGRHLFARYLSEESFVRQFLLMRGVMVRHMDGPESAFLVMLNGARRGEWAAYEEALVGHEFGHAWLLAQGYPAPVYRPGPNGCLSIHTTDLVQHILIRRDMEARGIPHAAFTLKSLEEALQAARTWADGEGMRRARQEPCLALRQLAEWVDARMGPAPEQWSGMRDYEAEMRRIFPGLEEPAAALEHVLRAREVSDHQQHREAIEAVYTILADVAARLAAPPEAAAPPP